MKLNKILSTMLVTAIMLGLFASLIPITASAQESETVIDVMNSDDVITDIDAVKEICNNYFAYKDFDSALELLQYESELGYLDSLVSGNYAVYVNRYTGLMYYVNLLTGQILTSNPIDPAYQTQEGGVTVTIDSTVLGQLQLEYFEITSTKVTSYDSLYWIMEGSLLKVSADGDSLVVEYTLGSAGSSFLAPGAMLFETAREYLFGPMFNNFKLLMEKECGPFDPSLAKSQRLNITGYDITEQDIYQTGSELYDLYSISGVLSQYSKYVLAYFNGDNSNPSCESVRNFISQMTFVFNYYDIIRHDKASDVLRESIGALNEGKDVILLDKAERGETSLVDLRSMEKAIKLVNPAYTFDMIATHEKECGFVTKTGNVPSFRVSICYSIDSDGALIVEIPENRISFNESLYAIKSITPLKYFGAGDMNTEGYVFYPDGSGSVVKYDDFYFGSGNKEQTNTAIYIETPIYGDDYCYSAITGDHREQITMPVFGSVSEANANNTGLSADESTVTNGYFTIIEEGSAVTSIGYESGGGKHKFMSAFTVFKPYPTDTYDLSQSISVSGLGAYTVVAPAEYNGSYKTKTVMLVDEDIANGALASGIGFVGYPSSYVGMATCYRNYLEDQGVIQLIEEEYSDLPLYVEALGSIDVTKRILSFPVTVSTPLTTFEDVKRMYKELSDAQNTLLEKSKEYTLKADELEKENSTTNLDEIARYRELSAKYAELSENVTNITNVNFRLTGFSNGGMYFTYPSKVQWENSVGGKKGFLDLISTALDANKTAGNTFGIYPDFDFMYVNNTSSFDGVNHKRISACMVDNRYASKQVYNSVNQKFESLFALVVSSDSMESLYNKFNKKYSSYSATGLSVSTMGSDLNSNFNEQNPIVREDSISNIRALLAKMSESYSLMSDKGNIYAVEYFDHILSAPIDSSHFNNSSFAVPFYGMVLHGYVNYTGNAINYSGSPRYELLRSIESGASLYYVLCTQNTNYLKEDKLLSEYFGVDYKNWYEKILTQYNDINKAIGDLQKHLIVDHKTIVAEREISEEERTANYESLVSEFVMELDGAISRKIDEKIKWMRENNMIGVGLNFSVSTEELEGILALASERINLSVSDLNSRFDLADRINAVFNGYSIYSADGDCEQVSVSSEDIVYKTKYKFVTDSLATDGSNYVKTDYTSDNGNVVMVTYSKGEGDSADTVVFILNYNYYTVEITVDNTVDPTLKDGETKTYILDQYEYIRINKD